MASPRFWIPVCAVVVALTVPIQGRNGTSMRSKEKRVYEDSEVRIAIPLGWSIASQG
jgi:hypothetical protein